MIKLFAKIVNGPIFINLQGEFIFSKVLNHFLTGLVENKCSKKYIEIQRKKKSVIMFFHSKITSYPTCFLEFYEIFQGKCKITPLMDYF